MDELEREVREFVAEQTGVKPERIAMETRVVQDLDVDGDAAVELFDAFAQRFRVEMEPLHLRWESHFSTESDLTRLLPWLIASIAAGVGGFELHVFVPTLSLWIAWPVAFVACAWICWRLTKKDRPAVPITVADMVVAARAHRWVKTYDE